MQSTHSQNPSDLDRNGAISTGANHCAAFSYQASIPPCVPQAVANPKVSNHSQPSLSRNWVETHQRRQNYQPGYGRALVWQVKQIVEFARVARDLRSCRRREGKFLFQTGPRRTTFWCFRASHVDTSFAVGGRDFRRRASCMWPGPKGRHDALQTRGHVLPSLSVYSGKASLMYI